MRRTESFEGGAVTEYLYEYSYEENYPYGNGNNGTLKTVVDRNRLGENYRQKGNAICLPGDFLLLQRCNGYDTILMLSYPIRQRKGGVHIVTVDDFSGDPSLRKKYVFSGIASFY